MTLASLLMVALLPKEAISLKVGVTRARAFKGEELSTPLAAGSKKRRNPTAQLELVAIPEGLEARIEGEGNERVLFALSRFAGVFGGVRVRIGVLDPLGMFTRSEVYEIPLTFEFLPTSLLARREPLRVSAAMLGDYPAGRSGPGQEFYSAEIYNPSNSSREIMWKRQARMPTDYLVVRVGEANIPEKLTVCFIDATDNTSVRTPRWMDLASEAIARLGLPVVSSGTTLRVLHEETGEMTVAEARDAGGLANLLLWLWRKDILKESTRDGPGQADMIVAPEAETQGPEVAGLILAKPTVLLGWGQRPRTAPGYSVIFFTGSEDLRPLVARVLSR